MNIEIKSQPCPWEIGLRMKKVRDKFQFSQKDIAILAGVSTTTISRLERGKALKIEYGLLIAIAKGSDIYLSYLLGISDEIRTYDGRPYYDKSGAPTPQ